ncbi:MAG: DegT/DnrJ/EryC1/StrS family aminotransferase [Bdellovibrionales bacterium]|nr:DegT/DnrJ/EryC1/StrS family aminotransferase [Bdellovibrionales bacterium]
MQVPLLDLSAQYQSLESELREAVLEVLASTRYIMGPKVEALESEIARYVGADFGIGVSSGTDALLVALMALDIKAGDIVLTSPYSFFATAGVVARLGAVPAFVDINPDSYNIDVAAVEQWLADNPTKRERLKAIIPVHLYGQCADMKPLMELADRYQVAVIEDAAQAIGATYPGFGSVRSAGSMGTCGCYSFFPSKNLGGIGDGGMVVTSDPKLAEKLRRLRNHGAEPKYYHSMIGGNFRLDPIQAAVLSVKLPHLDSWHRRRQENAQLYDELLIDSGVKTPSLMFGRAHHIYNQYVVSVSAHRDELRQFLQEKGIGTEVYYPVPFHEQECFRYLGYETGEFPESERAAQHTLALPIFPELERDQITYVAEQIRNFLSR